MDNSLHKQLDEFIELDKELWKARMWIRSEKERIQSCERESVNTLMDSHLH